MTLHQKQATFVRLLGLLIAHVYATDGYELTLGEGWRSPEEAKRLAHAGLGIIDSLHTQRLAIDLNLFKHGVYLTATEDYRWLGEWWEAQSSVGIQCCWGGRFTRADGNHFSVAHDGRK